MKRILTKGEAVLFFLIIAPLLLSCAMKEKRLSESVKHYEYGILYFHAEDLERANKEFEKALSLNADNDKALFGLGLINYFQGEFQDAVEFYKKAIKINPKVPEYYNNLAAANAKLGNWEKVIQQCQIALEIPSYPNPEFAYYNMGTAYLNLGDPRKAVEFLEKSKQINPSYIDTNLQLARALIKLREFQDAVVILDEAKKLEDINPAKNPGVQAEIEYLLGQSYLGLGDIESAKISFQAVIDKWPNTPLAEESSKYLKTDKSEKK